MDDMMVALFGFRCFFCFGLGFLLMQNTVDVFFWGGKSTVGGL